MYILYDVLDIKLNTKNIEIRNMTDYPSMDPRTYAKNSMCVIYDVFLPTFFIRVNLMFLKIRIKN